MNRKHGPVSVSWNQSILTERLGGELVELSPSRCYQATKSLFP
jgi:hypothetical protein